jgi:hypothetical protein
MWAVIYHMSVWDHAQDPLEWFPFGTPDPLSGSAMPDLGLGVAGFIRRRVPLGWVLPISSN